MSGVVYQSVTHPKSHTHSATKVVLECSQQCCSRQPRPGRYPRVHQQQNGDAVAGGHSRVLRSNSSAHQPTAARFNSRRDSQAQFWPKATQAQTFPSSMPGPAYLQCYQVRQCLVGQKLRDTVKGSSGGPGDSRSLSWMLASRRFSRSVGSDSCSPVDCSPPGSSVCGILQIRILQWVAVSFFRCVWVYSLKIH